MRCRQNCSAISRGSIRRTRTITTLPHRSFPGTARSMQRNMSLRKASDARTFDWYPLFHYGFLFYHFHKDPATGAKWLLKAVPRVTNQQDEWALQQTAAAWIEKGYQTANAAGMVAAMAEKLATRRFSQLPAGPGPAAARPRCLAGCCEAVQRTSRKKGRKTRRSGQFRLDRRDPQGPAGGWLCARCLGLASIFFHFSGHEMTIPAIAIEGLEKHYPRKWACRAGHGSRWRVAKRRAR
jgi:hypothetical protein